MILLGMKGIKYNFIRKFKGEAAAYDYVKKTALLWSNHTIKSIGINLEIRGQENLIDEPCLFVANHQSLLDIPALIVAINKPVGFIGKKELSKIPVLSKWMGRSKSIFLDRENVREAIKSMNEGIENIKKGYSMAIFPEGTRSKSDNVLDFKKGSLKLALKPLAPIIPVSINGTYKSLEEHNRVRKADVIVTINKPIYTKDLSKEEISNLSVTVRNIIIDSKNKK